MFAKTLIALGFVASSLALTITTPNPNTFWVQNTSNVINWDFSSGDPSHVDITITNSNSAVLNGVFSIQRNVDASNGSFTVTNVTLRVDSGYIVNFVNGTNTSQIFASSQAFEVKKPGTPPAPGSTPSGSTHSPSASSSSSSGGNGSPTASSSRGAASSNAAVAGMGGGNVKMGVVVGAVGGVVGSLMLSGFVAGLVGFGGVF